MARKDRYGFKGVQSMDDIEKIEKLSNQKPYPSSFYQGLVDSAEDNPNESALSYFLLASDYKKPIVYTYTQVLKEVNQLSNLLFDLGIRSTDPVALILPNMPEACFALVAAQTAGIAFPINPLLEKKQILQLLDSSEAKAIITIGHFVKTDVWEKVDAIRGEAKSVKHVIQVDLGKYLLGIKKPIVKLICKLGGKHRAIPGQEIVNYELAKSNFATDRLSFDVDSDPAAPAAYFHTGGTTGMPKIAIQTHENISFNCWSAGQMMDTSIPELNVYGGLPMFHVFGAMVTLSLCWVGSGHLLMISPQGFRGDGVMKHFWNIMKHHNINVIAAVPAIYKQLNDAPVPDGVADQLSIALSAAAPMPKGTMIDFEKRTGVPILEGYGCTEATCMVAVNPPNGAKKVGSVGIRIPYTKIKTFQRDGNDSCWLKTELNQIGTVALQGKHVFKGYKEEYHNETCWIDFEGERYYNTGDLGRIDEDGYLWLTGRKKELIIRGGHNIDPKIIEEVMYLHPKVAAAAAVGRPDERVGEVPVLYVELKSDVQASKEELLQFAAERISERAATPKELILIDQIPMTTIGKTFKPKLIELELKKVVSKVLKNNELTFDFTINQDPQIGRYVKFIGANKTDENHLKDYFKNYNIQIQFG